MSSFWERGGMEKDQNWFNYCPGVAAAQCLHQLLGIAARWRSFSEIAV